MASKQAETVKQDTLKSLSETMKVFKKEKMKTVVVYDMYWENGNKPQIVTIGAYFKTTGMKAHGAVNDVGDIQIRSDA